MGHHVTLDLPPGVLKQVALRYPDVHYFQVTLERQGIPGL
jgi:hypothetical protein